jgi:MFS family permease
LTTELTNTVLIIANYGVILYISLGMTGFMPLLLTSLWVTSTFPGNIFCAFYVEKFGRRPFLLTGLTGILVCLICEIALQAQVSPFPLPLPIIHHH